MSTSVFFDGGDGFACGGERRGLGLVERVGSVADRPINGLARHPPGSRTARSPGADQPQQPPCGDRLVEFRSEHPHLPAVEQRRAGFEFVVGYSRLLGKQRVLRQVLRQTDVECRNLLSVGAEVRDIAAAQRAGVDVAAVTWRINSKDALAEHAQPL